MDNNKKSNGMKSVNDHSGVINDTEQTAQKKSLRKGASTSLQNSMARILKKVNIAIAIVGVLYLSTVFFNIPILSDARDIWIETAMTTADHQWLATRLFPRWLVDQVMSGQINTEEGTISDPSLLHALAEKDPQNNMGLVGSDDTSGAVGAAREALEKNGFSWYDEATPHFSGDNTQNHGESLIGQLLHDMELSSSSDTFAGEYLSKYPAVGDKDKFGNTVIISDIDEEIIGVEISKTGYTGRILFVFDPSRVVVRNTLKKDVQGEFIKTYLDKYGAIAGMNGNGFDDPEGRGKGGTIIGWSVSDGVEWGQGPKSEYASVAFNDQHILMVGKMNDFKANKIRDLAQYGPSMIVDGERKISGSAGWGIQPRSAIGQREDGTVLLATFDGRQPGYSLGITVGEVSDILFEYGCVNAGLCDGGSSSIMMYDGEILGKPSTPMKETGRYLPNSILVLSANPAKALPE
ncbi:MAG: phosphodiester glycosidase family protein [Oscillospiraceae bacterium]|nr:phosphodiester glycosidase family protein [Oscillospiraceae bacterium]